MFSKKSIPGFAGTCSSSMYCKFYEIDFVVAFSLKGSESLLANDDDAVSWIEEVPSTQANVSSGIRTTNSTNETINQQLTPAEARFFFTLEKRNFLQNNFFFFDSG